MGHPTRPTQPSILDYEGEIIKQQTRAAYGCLSQVKVCGRRLSLRPISCTPALSVTRKSADTDAVCGMWRCIALYAYAFAFLQNTHWRSRRDVLRGQSVPQSGSSNRKSSIADGWKTGSSDTKRWWRSRAETSMATQRRCQSDAKHVS